MEDQIAETQRVLDTFTIYDETSQLLAWFDRTHDHGSLGEAVSRGRIALEEAISQQKPAADMLRYSLSQTLSVRYDALGDTHDLDEAIMLCNEAIATLPKKSGNWPVYHAHLSNLLTARANQRTGVDPEKLTDLQKAIDANKVAISSTNIDESVHESTRMLGYLSNFAYIVRLRYAITKNIQDLDDSIWYRREVLDLMKSEGEQNQEVEKQDRIREMHHLGKTLMDKQIETEDRGEKLTLILEAVDLAEKCVEETEEDHGDMPRYLYALAEREVLLALYRARAGDVSSMELLAAIRKAAYTFRKAFDKTSASPLSRIASGHQAGIHFARVRDYESASQVLSECVRLFHRVSPLSLDEQDRQRQLRGLTGIASLACAACIALKQPEAAIEVLEAGRGIMANITMRQHDRLPELAEADPSLHKQYLELRQAVSQAPAEPTVRVHDLVAQRNAKLAELEALETTIRSLPGLENFNKGLSAQQMCRLLDSHGATAIVAFCTVSQRCDALVVTTEEVVSVSLPKLRYEDIQSRIPLLIGPARLSLLPPSKRKNANAQMRKLLAWLWDAAVQPVLRHLGLLQVSYEHPAGRICWITSGPLGLMPLHAAGNGASKLGQNVFDHVSSSYAVSFSALAYARERDAHTTEEPPHVALFTMPKTPGRSALSTEQEASSIREAFSDAARLDGAAAELTELCQPSSARVLEQVRRSNGDIFHFSCHAEPDLNDPSRTSILFGSNPSAPTPDGLAIAELRKYTEQSTTGSVTRSPQLAYLSACCTAQHYSLDLLDESIHLAAAFQLSGFPSVVGTLWEADDKAAAFIARVFYRELLKTRRDTRWQMHDLERSETVDVYSRALHKAMKACREAKFGRVWGRDDVLLWANFVHFGV